jgi:transposase
MTVKDLSGELGIKDSTLRGWACECEEMGDGAFPGNGSSKIDKDHEVVKLEKKVEELERENEILKNFRGFLSQGHARGSSSSKSIGARSAPSRRHAGR